MSDAGVLAGDGRLATELVAALEPRLQDALNHPTRREILRVLHAGSRPRSLSEVLEELRPLSRAEVSYHVQVLEDAECVEVEGTWPSPGGRERLLQSAIVANEQARLVLVVTQSSDREHRQEGDHSSSFLTMFRVPRPTRTISLRMGRRRKEASR